jgi:hypothetical protein
MTGASAGPPAARSWWLRLAVGVLFFGWLYGMPLLFGLGLLTRAGDWPEAVLAAAYARTTRYFVAGFIVAFALPVLGLGLAGVLRWTDWIKRFVAAAGCSIAAVIVLSLIGSSIHGPLFGQRVEPSWAPSGRGCAIYSGGSNDCPGG